jgi:hypothetical protein
MITLEFKRHYLYDHYTRFIDMFDYDYFSLLDFLRKRGLTSQEAENTNFDSLMMYAEALKIPPFEYLEDIVPIVEIEDSSKCFKNESFYSCEDLLEEYEEWSILETYDIEINEEGFLKMLEKMKNITIHNTFPIILKNEINNNKFNIIDFIVVHNYSLEKIEKYLNETW